jgi:3-methyl-2-oxobutanoate hydroxymethyltransferase
MEEGKRNNSSSTNGGKVTVNSIMAMKQKKEKVAMITAYDYSTALICDKASIDGVLVGDSAGMVMLGYSSTIPVGMQEMLIFCKAVSRAIKKAMIIADMPFGSYQGSIDKAVHNAIRFIKAGSDAVKVEGGLEAVPIVKSIVSAGIPVMGHIGFKPQTSEMWENHRLYGKTTASALKLIQDARELEKAGIFSIVLEMVTSEVASMISENLSIPTIGIGSGLGCDGQVLVLHDMLGIYEDIKPKFVKRYAELSKPIFEAISLYIDEVKAKRFPEEQNSFHIAQTELKGLLEILNKRSEKKIGEYDEL